MEKNIILVDGMSCEHCVAAVTNGLSELAGVDQVTVDLAEKTVTVEHDPAQSSLDRIKQEIEDLGYDIM